MDYTKVTGPESMFCELIYKIFQKSGYEVSLEGKISESDIKGKFYTHRFDMIASLDKLNYCIEIKFSKITEKMISRFYEIGQDFERIPVIVTPFEVSKKQKQNYRGKYPKLVIIDISNLVYILNDKSDLMAEMSSILPISVEEIPKEEPLIPLGFLEHCDYVKTLEQELKLCKKGKEGFKEYEEICTKILKYLFSNELTLWKSQEKSNKDLYRFDLFCRIKDDNNKTFWSIMENYFRSKYIIFDFKNYTEKISQKEIYTTEKYLYLKALRSVAFVITNEGYDKNALWATRGCLREHGKLILLLTNQDLLNMIKKKNEDENPSDYLLIKLDEILLDLEK